MQDVTTWEELDKIRNGLSGEYRLTQDLTTEDSGYAEYAGESANGGSGWNPIGGSPLASNNEDPFTGVFDGNGYSINGVVVDQPEDTNVGLFGGTDSNSTVKDVSITDISIAGNDKVGAVVGCCQGTVSGVAANGDVTADTDAGGIAGRISSGDGGVPPGEVTKSYTTVTVIARDDIGLNLGGLTGLSTGVISQSFAAGSIGGTSFVGGLAGIAFGTVEDSYATSELTANGVDIGGLIGSLDGELKRSYAVGTGPNVEGGLVGNAESGPTVEESYYFQGPNNGNGTQLEQADMQGEEPPKAGNMEGFDFTTTWETVTGDGNAAEPSYPILTAVPREAQLSDREILQTQTPPTAPTNLKVSLPFTDG